MNLNLWVIVWLLIGRSWDRLQQPYYPERDLVVLEDGENGDAWREKAERKRWMDGVANPNKQFGNKINCVKKNNNNNWYWQFKSDYIKSIDLNALLPVYESLEGKVALENADRLPLIICIMWHLLTNILCIII